MARYPGAVWRPVSGHTDGPMRSYKDVVLHVNDSVGNLYNWVAGDHNMSCHFEVYLEGLIEQYLDTNVTSWCQMAGNADYLSIETEGYPTQPLTSKQLVAIAKLMRWLNQEHGIPLELAEHPGDRGLGWHGMGGAAWGGHTGCPGDLRKAQRGQILELARASRPLPTPSKPPATPAPTTGETTMDDATAKRFDELEAAQGKFRDEVHTEFASLFAQVGIVKSAVGRMEAGVTPKRGVFARVFGRGPSPAGTPIVPAPPAAPK